MKLLTVLLIAGSLVTVSARTTFADSDSYLFDVLAQPAYRSAWDALFIGEKNVDSWVLNYAKTKAGPAFPGKTVPLGGIAYQINMVCKAHDCGGNRFYVLFAPKGTKAWGLLLKNDKNERFFGKPDHKKKKVLRAATQDGCI